MKQRIYLDTSVFSALHDSADARRQEQTIRFWSRREAFELRTSDLTRIEVDQTPDAARRKAMLESLAAVPTGPLTQEMRDLAQRYIDQGVFTGRMENDALHVAAAVFDRCQVLLSWNFRHLVNRRRRAAINMVNAAVHLPTIDIIAPPEL